MTTMQKQEDVVDLLLAQHSQIKAMFSELATAQGPHRRELFEDLVRLLAVHESAEELVVHPAARKEAGDAVVQARLTEEDEAKRALADLYDLGVDHPEFNTRLNTLSEAVVTHASKEEAEEFSRLRANVPQERLMRMADAVRTAERMAPTRPHPHSGESPGANLLAGPPLALFDRVRDVMRDWREKNDNHRG
ncbi:hemerythrin domain-containing protein [Rhizomonospora bruguierae]|uniref:hemerythrin domain-containing protein n=1 Tax=Rhizomonospora bruguierae TaxID=1581705 RepID=UPI001BCEA2FA|nr:hemerythrin domain-containing protein [Micromonospora sp. NBRC 107566]